jgi:predicted MFS family arabinose efflux permease
MSSVQKIIALRHAKRICPQRARERMSLPDKRIVICALGITQILAWGSTFYLPAVLAPIIVRDTGWPYDVTVGGASVGLMIAGLAAPPVGRLINERGGRGVLAAGALLLAAGLSGIALAPNVACYLAAWAVTGVGMSASLYDAAFSTVGKIYGAGARSLIASLTLFGGFASTVCWPLSAFLAAHLGWRGACATYAAIQIGVALPLLLLALPHTSSAATDTTSKARRALQLRAGEFLLFVLLAAVLTIAASILAIVGTHLLPILIARGLDTATAVGLGVIIGPSQVGARTIEMLAGSRYHPVWTMVASAVLVAIAAAMLMLELPMVALAIVLYGAGNGIGSVARGTLPLALFGSERYPVLMGRLAFPLMLAMALSPFIGGVIFQRGGAAWTLLLLTALASLNVALVAILRIMIWRFVRDPR